MASDFPEIMPRGKAARAPGIDPGTSMIAGFVQLLEEPDGLRAWALSEAVDDSLLDGRLLEELAVPLASR